MKTLNNKSTTNRYFLMSLPLLLLFIIIYFSVFSKKNSHSFSARELPSSCGKVLFNHRISINGQSGHLIYGPYVKLDSGRYLVKLNYSSKNTDTNTHWEIFFAKGNINLSSGILPEKSNGVIEKRFTISGNLIKNPLEFRVFYSGTGSLSIENLVITKVIPINTGKHLLKIVFWYIIITIIFYIIYLFIYKFKFQKKQKRSSTLLAYFASAFLTLITLSGITGLHTTDLSIPQSYYGDGKEVLMKMVSYTGINKNYLLNAPYSMKTKKPDLVSFISTATLPFQKLLVKFLGFFIKDRSLLTNIYFILTFFLIVFCSIFVMSKFRIPYLVSIPLAIIYAFLPYHFHRQMIHWGENYYLVPLLALILFWIGNSKPLFFKYKNGKFRLSLLNKKALFCIVLLFIISEAHYHAFFFIMLAFFAGILAAVKQRKKIYIASILILFLLLGANALKPKIPNIIFKVFYKEQYTRYQKEHRKIIRHTPISSYGDAETFGLKLTQLLLPDSKHNLKGLKRITQKYKRYNPLNNENMTTTLGILVSLGLLIILWQYLIKRNKQHELFNRLGFLTIMAILIGTIGGLGSLLSILVTTIIPNSIFTQIRAYNRIFVFISFFALTAISILFTRLHIYFKKNINGSMNLPIIGQIPQSKIYFLIILIPLILLALWDIAPGKTRYFHNKYQASYNSDKAFIKKIEKSLPTGSMIFQLPYKVHHISGPINKCTPSDFYSGYFFSTNLKWSYGSDLYSPHQILYKNIAELSPDKMLNILSTFNFSGVYIDRQWNNTNAAYLERKISQILGIKPIISNNLRYSFFNILKYKEKTLRTYSYIQQKQFIDKYTKKIYTINMDKSIIHKVGRISKYGKKYLLESQLNEKGFLFFGKGCRVPDPGRYQVIFNINVKGNTGKYFAIADVNAIKDQRNEIFSSKKLLIKNQGKQNFTLEFKVNNIADTKKYYECRLQVTGEAKVKLYKVSISRL